MVQSEAQKRAKRNYHAKMMANPEYRQRKSQNASRVTLKKYKEDDSFRKNMLEYQFWKYYYDDAEEKAIKAIRRLF